MNMNIMHIYIYIQIKTLHHIPYLGQSWACFIWFHTQNIPKPFWTMTNVVNPIINHPNNHQKLVVSTSPNDRLTIVQHIRNPSVSPWPPGQRMEWDELPPECDEGVMTGWLVFFGTPSLKLSIFKRETLAETLFLPVGFAFLGAFPEF